MTQSAQYRAQACGPGCTDKLDNGTLWFTHEGASFRGEGAAFTLPMEGLRVDRAGATGDTIRITNPAHPDWFICTGDLAILREPVLVSRGDLKKSIKMGRRRGLCCLGGCLSLLIVAALVIFALAASRDAIVGALSQHFPPEMEQRIGDMLIHAVVPPGSELTQPDLVDGLNAIAGPVLEAIPPGEGFTSFTLHLSSDPTPNAFAIPGGHIIVNAGLITLADNADEVAGVIAHEAAHATLRHGLQSLISRAGTAAIISLVIGDAEGVSSILIDGSGYLLNQKYSRDFERQADEKAWEYLQKANVNPAGLASFFEKLKTLQGGANPPAILSTHPATDERIKMLEGKLKATPGPKGDHWHEFALDYQAYRNAVGKASGK